MTSAHSRPISSAWLPATSAPARLEADLRARGWSLWRGRDGSLTVTAPGGHRSTHHEPTTAQTLRHAYAAAQEHEGAALRESLGRGRA